MKEKHGQFIHLYWEDESDVEYIKGHVTEAEAKAAFDRYAGDGSSDGFNEVRHCWARWHFAGAGSDFDFALHVQSEKGRGTFPVTELSISQLDGTISGDMHEGPVTITLRDLPSV